MQYSNTNDILYKVIDFTISQRNISLQLAPIALSHLDLPCYPATEQGKKFTPIFALLLQSGTIKTFYGTCSYPLNFE